MVVQPVDLSFHPPLPAKQLGLLKDMAQDVIIASSTLERRIAAETAGALGDRLRLINSYHSNLIEGHKTTILDIEAALHKDYSRDAQRRLCSGALRRACGDRKGLDAGAAFSTARQPVQFRFCQRHPPPFLRTVAVLYLARIGINRSNLWSLSRGFSRNKQWV